MSAVRQRRGLDPDVLAWSMEHLRGLLVPPVARHGGRVLLFGSHARGDARWYSDIDLAIDAPAELPGSLYADLVEAIEESSVPYRVELVELARSGDAAFRERVRSEGIAWTASHNEAYAEAVFKRVPGYAARFHQWLDAIAAASTQE